MNLNKIVDEILLTLYSEEGARHEGRVEIIVTNMGLPFNEGNSKMICDKVDELPYYDVIKLASKHGYDSIVVPNAKGLEFFQEYGSYSNYLAIIKSRCPEPLKVSQ